MSHVPTLKSDIKIENTGLLTRNFSRKAQLVSDLNGTLTHEEASVILRD